MEYINWAIEYLEEQRIENPRCNAEAIFSFVSGKNRLQIYLEGKEKWEEKQAEEFISLVKKRAQKRYPLHYLIKKREFYGLDFKTIPGVFIPRPETEVLVETVINMVKCLNGKRINLLEIGTGSGCIAIALAKFIANVKIIATDISPLALKIARENAYLNKTDEKIEFIHSDLFASVPNQEFEMIVSNPPYIARSEMLKLPPEVKFEPSLALDGGEDGLDYIKKIVEISPDYLSAKGIVIMEIGFGQKEKVKHIFSLSGFKKIQFIKDYAGIDRVVVLYRNYG